MAMGRDEPVPPPLPYRSPGPIVALVPVATSIFAVVLLVIFGCAGLVNIHTWSAKYSYDNRFESSNASGATANAVEDLAERPDYDFATWLVALLLVLVVFKLSQIGELLRRRN